MAKKSSERVMTIRQQRYDRISFVMEKDARHLIRAQAIREGVTSSEVMRRAILARCGLDTMPDTSTEQYQAIREAEIRPEAEEALSKLQEEERNAHKEWERLTTYLVMFAGKEERDAYIVGLLDLLNTIEDTTVPTGRSRHPFDKIVIEKSKVLAIRRLLSNLQEVEPDTYDESEETY